MTQQIGLYRLGSKLTLQKWSPQKINLGYALGVNSIQGTGTWTTKLRSQELGSPAKHLKKNDRWPTEKLETIRGTPASGLAAGGLPSGWLPEASRG